MSSRDSEEKHEEKDYIIFKRTYCLEHVVKQLSILKKGSIHNTNVCWHPFVNTLY